MASIESKPTIAAEAAKIVLCSNTAWSIFNFREGLIRELIQRGFEVITIAPWDDFSNRLASLGCTVIDQPMDNKGTNPLRDFVLFYSFLRLYTNIKPVMAMHFTIKPVIYGGLAASVLRVPYLSVITGLGSVFTEENWITRAVEYLYRVSQVMAVCVFFLNKDDRDVFLDRNLLSLRSKQKVLPGSGVNIKQFSTEVLPGEGVNTHYFSPFPLQLEISKEIKFLLSARMLWEKGVGIYVDAARLVKRKYSNVRFQLLGPLGVLNRSAVDTAQMDAWVSEGIVEYMGNTSDVRPYIRDCDCVVLPSYYREGVPRSLLEAASMAKPIITTDSVGCRDVLDDGISGYLCQPRNAESLAAAMLRFVALTPEQMKAMGAAGRVKIEREFDERIVIKHYIDVLDQVVAEP